MAVAAPLVLREGDLPRLEALTRSTSVRAGLAQRARIVLLAAQGLTNTEIARRTGSSRPTVLTWRQRYEKGGIAALEDRPRSGRPGTVDEIQVVAATLANNGRPPSHLGATHWSARLLAEQLDISYSTVARIWRKWGIQPQRVHAFRPPFISEFEAALSGPPTKSRRRIDAVRGAAGTGGASALPARPTARRGGGPEGPTDPWSRLVEISLAIITHQAVRRGTFSSVYNLIEAIGALTDDWGERDEPTLQHWPPGRVPGMPHRQETSSTRLPSQRGLRGKNDE